ncbi:GTPase HflX [Candidatus Dependentiae bacterium]|nr:MAG: GTPase HflX [Candidatus Dependentiae bacterium]
MSKPSNYSTDQHTKTLLAMVHAPYNRTKNIQSYFDEFLNLVKTANIKYEDALSIKLRDIDTAYFFTKGKLAEIREVCEAHNIKQVIISDQLTPQQARNLEDYLECELMDRTDLILDIFEKAAVSAEGKVQVGIALLAHQKTRLAGKGIHLEQQAGITGLRGGSGETVKERDRRHIDEQIKKLKKQLDRMQKARAIQRKQRLERKVLQLCLIGYTNAGKSTILNTLTKSDVLAEDKLFATLDTTTRALFVDGKQIGVLSDTVGFIQQLPHRLIEAFKSTLSELQYADLLLQVIDLSDPNWEAQIKVVHEIIEELDLHEKQMLYVFNKADQVADREAVEPQLELYEPHVVVSATSREGLKPLLSFLKKWSKSPSPSAKATEDKDEAA